jgi:hypothetical protein
MFRDSNIRPVAEAPDEDPARDAGEVPTVRAHCAGRLDEAASASAVGPPYAARFSGCPEVSSSVAKVACLR